MSDALKGAKVILRRGNTRIAKIRGIGELSISAGILETTSFRSNRIREFVGTVVDGGSITFTIQFNYTLPTHRLLYEDLRSLTAHAYSVTFPDSTPTALEFSALVTNYNVVAELETSVVATVTMKMTGEHDWVEGTLEDMIDPPFGVLPTDGLLFWLDANRRVTNTGGAITTWTDPSNFDNFATRSGVGAECQLELAVQNGLSAVRLDNRHMTLTFPAGASWTANAGHAFFAAAGASGGQYMRLLSLGTGAPSVEVSDRIYYSNGSLCWGYTDSPFDSASRGAWSIWEVAWYAGGPSFYKDGSFLSIGGSAPLTMATGNYDRIGGGLDYAPDYDGDFYLGEMALFNFQLTGATLTAVRNYFMNRWLDP